MKMLLSALTHQPIEKLIINSLEQALYQAIVVIDGEEHVVWRRERQVLLSRNLNNLLEYFDGLSIPNVVLRHESSYDEMVGLEKNVNSNRLEVPLGVVAAISNTD